MKKALAVLLALVLVGAAFAQDAAPAETIGGIALTYGVYGEMGYNALKSDFDASVKDDSFVTTGKAGVGNGGAYFYMTPWAQGAIGGLTLKSKLYLDHSGYNIGNALDTNLTFKKDNVEAGMMWRFTGGENFFAYNDIIDIRNAYFKINKIFDLVSVKLGGYSTSSRNYYRMMSIDPDGLFTSQGTTIGRYTGTWSSKHSAFFTIAKSPLTAYLGFLFDDTDVGLNDWLATSPIHIGVKYALEGVGTFDAGANLGFDQKGNVAEVPAPVPPAIAPAAAPAMKGAILTAATNYFFFDANLSMVEKLGLQLGFDYKTVKSLDMKDYLAQVAAGKWTNASPVVPLYTPVSTMNIGLEATYDMAPLDLLLCAYMGMSTFDFAKLSGGATFDQMTTALKAADYVSANFTEANAKTYAGGADVTDAAGLDPLKIYLKVGYALNDIFSFTFKNTFNQIAGDTLNLDDTDADPDTADVPTSWVTGGKIAYGFYGSDEISLGVDMVAGAGTIGASFGFNIYTGLPTAADIYGAAFTAAQKAVADVEYKDFVDSNFNPWVLSLYYSMEI